MLNPTMAAQCCDPLWDEARLTPGHRAALTGARCSGQERTRPGARERGQGRGCPPGPPTGACPRGPWLSPTPKAAGGRDGDPQGGDRALLSLGRVMPRDRHLVVMAGLCSHLLELSRASPRWPPPRTRSAGTGLRPEVHVCPLPFPGPSLWLRELLGARGDLVGGSRKLGRGAVTRGFLSGSRAAWREAEGGPQGGGGSVACWPRAGRSCPGSGPSATSQPRVLSTNAGEPLGTAEAMLVWGWGRRRPPLGRCCQLAVSWDRSVSELNRNFNFLSAEREDVGRAVCGTGLERGLWGPERSPQPPPVPRSAAREGTASGGSWHACPALSWFRVFGISAAEAAPVQGWRAL